MSDEHSNDEATNLDGALARPATRRGFIGSAAAIAVGAPTLLAACGNASTPTAPVARAPGDAARADRRIGIDPWLKVHHLLAATIGADRSVRIPALEKAEGGYLQRIVVDDDRTGTALATVLRSSYRFDGASLTVSAEDSNGRRWPARSLRKQADLVYAMKDALAGNALAAGVLRESLDPGKPVVAVIDASVIRFPASAQSDFYGNWLQVASGGFSDIFSPDTGVFRITATTRDFAQC